MSTHPSHALAAGLRAAAAEVDITPAAGTQLAGDICRRRPTEGVDDPLYARALVIEREGRAVCLLSLDLLAVTRPWVETIRDRVQQEWGLEPCAVMVHVTQVHSAPGLGHFMVTEECDLIPPELSWLRGGDDAYHPFAVERVLEAIGRAHERLEPVTMAYASGLDGRVAFNRRFVMRDGRGEMFGAGDAANILYREGPADPEVGVAAFRADDGRIVAALLHHTSHPTHGFGGNRVTADWPGAWCERAKGLWGPECVPLVLNGCCGNVHHRDVLDPAQVDTAERMGRLLMETTERIVPTLEFRGVSSLDWRTHHIGLPLRGPSPEQIADARALLAEHPEPMWLDGERRRVNRDWFYALSRLDLAALCERQAEFDYEIQLFKLDDLAIVALTGEPFVEGQLRIKLESPAQRTFVAHMSNAYVGYIPTPEAIQRGGYETRTAYWSKLGAESLDRVVDATVEQLRRLFGRNAR